MGLANLSGHIFVTPRWMRCWESCAPRRKVKRPSGASDAKQTSGFAPKGLSGWKEWKRWVFL